MSDTAAQARQQTARVAGEATEATKQVTQAAKEQAATVAHDARLQLRSQADEQAAKVGGSMRRLSEEFRALSEGRTEEAGTARRYLQDAAAQIERVAGRIDSRGVDGIVDDVQRFARRRPAAFLAAAAGAGFAAGRLLRSVKDEGDESSPGMSPGEIRGQATAEMPTSWEASTHAT